MSEHPGAEIAATDAIHEVRRAMRALYITVPAAVARDVSRRVEAALAQAWDEGFDAGWAAQDPDDHAPNPYLHTPDQEASV